MPNWPLRLVTLTSTYVSGVPKGVTQEIVVAFTTTTEVYPDSPKVDDENCTQAQVAAVEGGLGYLLSLG